MSHESNPTGWSDVTSYPKVSMVINEVPSKSTRATRRRAQSFESLVRAGLAVIARRGVYETTVEHITEAADVGKGTFYAHFPSKEALLYYLVRNGFDEMIAAGRKECGVRRTQQAVIELPVDGSGQMCGAVFLGH
jgi:hypothetical protein